MKQQPYMKPGLRGESHLIINRVEGILGKYLSRFDLIVPIRTADIVVTGRTSFFCKDREGGKLPLYVEGKPKASFGDQPAGLVEAGCREARACL
jgi:hypothetical protein